MNGNLAGLEQTYSGQRRKILSKVPEVTIFFWIIKVLCTTVGETFADFLNFNLGFGLMNTTIIMGVAFFIVLFLQFSVRKYVPGIYWLTVVLISVFGTLVTDNMTDNMGIRLEVSTIVFSVLLGLTFLFWYLSEKTLSIHSIYTIKREVFYWLTILFTFALGTAVGDLYSEQLGFGYLKTGLTVIVIIACIFLAWKMKLDGILAFWIAYILTRPLGASLGDYLSQPKANGGLGLGTTVTSVIFLLAILLIIIYLAVSKIDITATRNETVEKNGNKKNVLVQTIAALCIFLVLGVGSYIWRSNYIASQSNTAQTTLAGQLQGFIKIENDMLKAVNSNDLSTAKKDADKLEHDWDAAEPKLRAIDGTTWTKIDGTIDVVLSSVRSSSPDVNKSKSALKDSLKVLDGANKSASNSTSSATTLSRQLTDFVKIENDMLKAVNSNDFSTAKKDADDLEHQWDTQEPRLRAIDGTTWTKIDGTIDVVLASIRSSNPEASKCKSALNHSLSVINAANK
ncbi:hypothetical protein MK805_09405 [Shimazuella sp. AN120528]|uniref:hypothetical protein n=1 Tax=Shimazuella soli TaxID=1892854 RepID=UPI001F0F4943|nr:hypothetical protein [Shimazuella soli]MCH5585186.1 hypothetical protein [Shimazuella soli]